MESRSDTVLITAECLCKAHIFSTDVPTSRLPLQGSVCHCDSCRHTTGALCVVVTTWPQPREDVDISGLQRYRFSANITYRFCGTCSALMFCEWQQYPNKLGVFSGTLRNIDAEIIRLTKNIYVGDTLDGGASVWLRKPNVDGKEIPRYRERTDEIPWNRPQASGSTEFNKQQKQESLPIWCHCKGVKLLLHRGDYTGRDKEQLPWFVDPRTHKRLASFEACDSCRLQFGTDIVNWTFVELTNITQPNGGVFPKTTAELMAAVDAGDPAAGTLAYYQSSPNVQRYFCRVCSASTFYACDDRPDIVDLAIGLLEAPDGARAEDFLSWIYGDEPAWVHDTKGGWREGLVKRIQAGAEDFRISSGYPKSWRRLEKEAREGQS